MICHAVTRVKLQPFYFISFSLHCLFVRFIRFVCLIARAFCCRWSEPKCGERMNKTESEKIYFQFHGSSEQCVVRTYCVVDISDIMNEWKKEILHFTLQMCVRVCVSVGRVCAHSIPKMVDSIMFEQLTRMRLYLYGGFFGFYVFFVPHLYCVCFPLSLRCPRLPLVYWLCHSLHVSLVVSHLPITNCEYENFYSFSPYRYDDMLVYISIPFRLLSLFI